jgi:para-aminobenzoate synthetase component 1
VTDPFAIGRCLAGRPGRAVLVSGRAGNGIGRRSIAASDPDRILVARGARAVLRDGDGRQLAVSRDVLGLLEELVAGASGPAPVAIGYLGYELGEAVVGLPPGPRRPPAVEPDLWFGRYPAYWQLDVDGGEAEVIAESPSAAAALRDRLSRGAPPAPPPRFGPLVPAAGADDAYRLGFDRVIEYLAAGDCYQVNLSRRLVATVERAGDPLAVLEALCAVKPEPYAALIETGDTSVISGSPERFLFRDASSARLETRPIKGTRRRTGEAARDARARAELSASDKERAEHLMIVDLERNDLGRLAETGSVRVDRFADSEELPGLYHLVSTISCRLRPEVSVADILRATFPSGSITGAPKRRAMEIIRELEPGARGVYTGAVGVLGGGGAIDLAIAIRTAVLCESALSLHVGGGVVIDSTWERELAETEEKAAGWREALQLLSAEHVESRLHAR